MIGIFKYIPILGLLVTGVLAPDLSAQTETSDVLSADKEYAKRMARIFGDVDPNSPPAISPDGKHIASIQYIGRYSKFRIDRIEDGKLVTTAVISEREGLQFTWYRWANNDRVILGMFNEASMSGLASRTMMAMDVDGGNGIVLLTPRTQSVRSAADYNPYMDNLGDILPDDPKHVLAFYSKNFKTAPDVFKVNIYTGERTRVDKLPKRKLAYDWYADTEGKVRLGFVYRRNKPGKMIVRNDKGKWVDVENDEMFADGRFSVEGFTTDPNLIYVTSSLATGRKSLFTYDLRTGKLVEKLFEHPEVDVADVYLSPGSGKPVAIRWIENNVEVEFFDEEFGALYQQVADALKSPFWITSMTRDERKAVIRASSDKNPGDYYILDRDTKQLIPMDLGYKAPGRKYARRIRPFSYEARDALKINAYLTLPKKKSGRKNLPLIVLAHGGPQARVSKSWNAEVHFLANLGYAVLQPNFRGSTGYGIDFVTKGFGEWHEAMLNDMIDGVDYLAGRGIVDPDRVCIMGTSYGGYAALMSAVKHGDRYRCAVSMAGISDIAKMLKYDGAYDHKNWYYQTVAGDRKKSQLSALSPIKMVKNLKIPVILGHGMEDEIVEPRQSRMFFKAAKSAGKDVAYFEYEKSGHGLNWEHEQVDWLNNVGLFLLKHNPPKTAPKSAENTGAEQSSR